MEEAAGLAGEALECALLGEGIDMALDGERARETEMRLNLTQRRRHALLALVGVDKIENLLLTGRERRVIGHSVQVNTSASKCNILFSGMAERRNLLAAKRRKRPSGE